MSREHLVARSSAPARVARGDNRWRDRVAALLGQVPLALFLAAPVTGQTTWSQAIEAVQEQASAYYDFALALDPTARPGTALQGIGHARHICAIVGRMLGFRDAIVEAETFAHPPMTADADPQVLMEHSMFLSSWVAAAKRAEAMTEPQKRSLWNLECVGRHGIPLTEIIEDPGLAGDFSVTEGTLVVYGDIDAGFHDRFVAALDANPDVTMVALGSAGGSVTDAIRAGVEIRRRGLRTELHGPCQSACPLIFAGGTERIIWMGPGPHLGFHQVYTEAGAVALSDPVYGVIRAYLDTMGVDGATVTTWMMQSDPYGMFEPPLGALCRPRIATWVQRIC